MLATVHWVATKDENPAQNSEQAILKVHDWNQRKQNLFKPQHIRKAWQRLEEQNWLSITSTQYTSLETTKVLQPLPF